ncbi:hypothetical protein [Microcoleus sp. FACHB-672]|uniref:hypothetical protein n=1 Tax=Microcoleus sp. FACHB-672 TaxID=2692825 RepID=UPI001682B3C3|nr:hypothetical protein [Microcoleus sp. FACHB-672]MBD2043268.1 hypothetical protein [Microcoleus sp. FACHB-672]
MSNTRLNTPSVTLYAFHWSDEISKGSQPYAGNVDHLWQRCVALGEHLQIPALQSLPNELLQEENKLDEFTGDKAEYLPLLNQANKSDKEPFLRLKSESQPDLLEIIGEIYPLKIQDTNAVDLTLRYGETVEVDQLSLLNSKGCLLPNFIQASIGQTLLIFAEPSDNTKDYKTLADACVEAFLKDAEKTSVSLISEGQLFGSPVFEYNTGSEKPADQCQILVWFDCYPTTLSLGEQAYHSIFMLLYCRHKIIFAYYQARLYYQQARELYNQLEPEIDNFATSQEETLEDLKQRLKQIPRSAFQYTKLLRDIEDYNTTITTIIKNYRAKLEEIRAHTLPEDKVDFLENFCNRTKELQNQIQIDLRYLQPGQQLFEQMIDAIRVVIEINAQEQAKHSEDAEKERDRNLKIWVAVVAAGFAVSVVSSAVNPRPIESILNQPHPDGTMPWPVTGLTYSVLDIILHLCLGLALALLLRPVIARLVPKSRN